MQTRSPDLARRSLAVALVATAVRIFGAETQGTNHIPLPCTPTPLHGFVKTPSPVPPPGNMAVSLAHRPPVPSGAARTSSPHSPGCAVQLARWGKKNPEASSGQWSEAFQRLCGLPMTPNTIGILSQHVNRHHVTLHASGADESLLGEAWEGIGVLDNQLAGQVGGLARAIEGVSLNGCMQYVGCRSRIDPNQLDWAPSTLKNNDPNYREFLLTLITPSQWGPPHVPSSSDRLNRSGQVTQTFSYPSFDPSGRITRACLSLVKYSWDVHSAFEIAQAALEARRELFRFGDLTQEELVPPELHDFFEALRTSPVEVAIVLRGILNYQTTAQRNSEFPFGYGEFLPLLIDIKKTAALLEIDSAALDAVGVDVARQLEVWIDRLVRESLAKDPMSTKALLSGLHDGAVWPLLRLVNYYQEMGQSTDMDRLKPLIEKVVLIADQEGVSLQDDVPNFPPEGLQLIMSDEDWETIRKEVMKSRSGFSSPLALITLTAMRAFGLHELVAGTLLNDRVIGQWILPEGVTIQTPLAPRDKSSIASGYPFGGYLLGRIYLHMEAYAEIAYQMYRVWNSSGRMDENVKSQMKQAWSRAKEIRDRELENYKRLHQSANMGIGHWGPAAFKKAMTRMQEIEGEIGNAVD